MSYPRLTNRIRPRRGVSSDVPPWTLGPDLYSQADNIAFRDGLAERAPSFAAVYDPPSVAPYMAMNIQIAGTNYWVYAGATSLYVVEAASHTNVTHASGQQSNTDIDELTLTQLNGVPIFNNAKDEPMYWAGNPANPFLDLPGWTATETCALIVPHRFHLFALGIDGPGGAFPNQVKWSDAAAPGSVPASWTASATNEAGDVVLADTPGAIISAANLRDALIIYKNGSVHRCDYVGGQEKFAFRTLFVEAGALTRHAVADINGRHLVVTDGDVVVTDGTNLQSIVRERRRKFLFSQLDQDNFRNLFTVYNRAFNECWICFPTAGNTYPNRAMIYDVARDAWGDRELDGITWGTNGIINDTAPDETWDADTQVWDADTSTWNQQSFSLATRDLVLVQPGGPDFLEVGRGTETLRSVLAKYSIDFGEPERFKLVKRIHPRIDAASGIEFSIRIGTQDSPEGVIAWQPTQTFNTSQQFINTLATGRFISVELVANTSAPFTVAGFDVEYEMRGYH